jgi:drug/metabolite transporter (DMT)-like permease
VSESLGPASARGGAVRVAAGAVCISFAPVFVRAVGHAIGPSAIAAWRTLLGFAILVLWCAARGESLRPPRRRALGYAVLAGVLLAADFAAWHRSIDRVGGGMATILGNTQVFWVALFGALVLREGGGARLGVAVLGGIAGVALLAGVLDEGARRADGLGVFFGCLTGVLYASYLLVLRHAGRDAVRLSPAGLLTWISLACGTASLAAAAATGETLAPPDARTWASLAGIALVAQVVGWMLIASGIPRVPVSRAGLLLLLQPTLAAVWGILFFDERFGAWQVVGAAVTLGAIYLGSTTAARATGRASSTIP